MRRLPGEYEPKPEPVHAKAQRPKMPKHLSGVAAEKWKELVKVLHKRGTLTKADGTQLEIVCVQYANWVALQQEIATEGQMVDTVVMNSSGKEIHKKILNPACKMATQLENSIRAGLQQIGSTPASRERSKPAKVPPSEAPLPPDSAGALAADVFDSLENENDKPQQEENANGEFDIVGESGEGEKEGGES